MLEASTLWRVGNDHKVYIWRDKWIPKVTPPKIQSPIKILESNAKVQELIDSDTRTWRADMLKDIFSREEVDLIAQIPISLGNSSDTLIWRDTSNGQFAVKSGYHLHKGLQ